MNQYDAIIVGCNISTLISGLSLLKTGYKVLIIDRANSIGELYSNVSVGRFSFYDSLNCLYLNNSLYDYSLSSILSNYNIDGTINATNLDCFCNLIIKYKNYNIPFGISEFINSLDGVILGSREILEEIIEYAKDCRDTMNYLYNNCDNIDYSYIKKEHKKFWSVSDLSLKQGLEYLNVSEELYDVLLRISIFFGNVNEEMSFVDYLVFLINVIENGIRVVDGGNNALFDLLLKKYNSDNGVLRLSANIVSIIVEDEVINGVRLDNGETIYTNKLIMNDSMSNVYKLINPGCVPRKALKHCNKLVEGSKIFSVHLGIVNKFNLKSGLYIIDEKTIVYSYMKNSNKMVSVFRYMDINELKKVNEKNVLQYCDMLAADIIDNLSKVFGCNLGDFIEEIKIINPFENSGFKYKAHHMDSILFRLINNKNEKYIKGLYVIDGLDSDLFAYASSLFVGFNSFNFFVKDGDLNE